MSERSAASSPGTKGAALTRKAIAAARLGDPEGIHYLYVRFGEGLLQHAVARLGDPELGAEMTKAVFAGLGGSIGAYDEGELTFEAWLSGEADRLARTYPRSSPPRDSARSISAR